MNKSAERVAAHNPDQPKHEQNYKKSPKHLPTSQKVFAKVARNMSAPDGTRVVEDRELRDRDAACVYNAKQP